MRLIIIINGILPINNPILSDIIEELLWHQYKDLQYSIEDVYENIN